MEDCADENELIEGLSNIIGKFSQKETQFNKTPMFLISYMYLIARLQIYARSEALKWELARMEEPRPVRRLPPSVLFKARRVDRL